MKAVKLGISTKCTYVLPDHCMYKNRTMMKAAVVLLPLLGLTWIFGLLAVNEHLNVFIWLFTVLNSLQVSLACLYSYKRVYCLLNRVCSYLSSTWSDMKRYIITLVHSIVHKTNETLFTVSHHCPRTFICTYIKNFIIDSFPLCNLSLIHGYQYCWRRLSA